jgi:FkbM family methyltransferase
VLLINADIQLRLSDWELRRIRWLSDGGLCYFVRYNHDGELAQASREPYGIDAFLLHGRDAAGFAEAFLSMEQPFSDYWLPLTLAARGLPLYAVDFPAAFHLSHQNGWSWETWHRCALEFNRVTGALGPDTSFETCMAAAWGVREQLDHQKIGLGQRPPPIRPWVEQTFGDPGPKLFLELGAHRGEDTAWMAAIPNVTIHAFEPDPRNYHATQPNVTLHQAAIADRDGRGPLHLSQEGWGQEWTCSSSIRRPKNHLQRFPVSFAGAVEVELVALDSFRRRYGLERIDFIWADIQGAEREMIQGGHETLARTRYIYTEYSDDELYEGQATLRELLTLLPSFRVIELWPDEVLLENQALAAAGR